MSAGGRSKAGANLESGQMAPGAHLRAVLGKLGLDQVAVSEATGVSRQTINNIINGRQAISRAMAGKLGRLTGHSSDYWLSERFNAKGAPARLAVAGLLVDHQIARAVKDGIISIKPYRPQNLQAAAIALTLSGNHCRGRQNNRHRAQKRFHPRARPCRECEYGGDHRLAARLPRTPWRRYQARKLRNYCRACLSNRAGL